MLKSRYKLTHSPSSSPWVLLDFDEWIEEEIRFPAAGGVEVIPLVDSPSPFLRDMKNTSYTFGYTVRRVLSTDALARTALLDSLDTYEGKGIAILKVEVAGVSSAYWQFAQCRVQSFTPAGRAVGLGQTLTEYQITAAGLSKVTVP